MGSTTDHSLLLCIQHGEDLNTMRAEPAGVIGNSGLDEYQYLTSKGFLPFTTPVLNVVRLYKGEIWKVKFPPKLQSQKWARNLVE